MKGRGRTATHSSWCTGAKRIGRMRSGKLTMVREALAWLDQYLGKVN
jgi:hypothetical protein